MVEAANRYDELMHANLLTLLILLTTAVVMVSLAKRLNFPTILAYLLIGIAVGPHGLAWMSESESISEVAEFGIVFLMFTIGLEFSVKKLMAMRKLVFGLGASQMLLTALGTGFVVWLGYGQGWRSGVAVGIAIAMSSTAIVARMLSERFELHSRSGRQTMGVLLFQDIAVVPCLILLPALATPGESLWSALSIAAVQAVLVLGVLIWLGQRYLGHFFAQFARHRSDELLVLVTLWFVVALSYLTAHSGLSMALGAFVGGMLISETIYRHQVEADIRPFRDILLGLFFVTVGMMLDLRFVFENLDLLALAVLLLIGGKALVMLVLTWFLKTPLFTSLRTAAQLAQAGEFGLVLINLAFALHLIPLDVFQITLSAMLLSMFIAPFLIKKAASLAVDLGRGDKAHSAGIIQAVVERSADLHDHVLICGYGRTGQRIADMLRIEAVPFVALDADPQCIRVAQARGLNVVFGNADRAEVLDAAGLGRAKVLVVSYPDSHSAERVIRMARAKRPVLPIIVRTSDEKDTARLKDAGATEVISEVLESGLMVAAETLVAAGVPVKSAMEHVRTIRADRYATLRDFYGATN